MTLLVPGCGLIGLVLVALSFAFWIWMLVDCLTNNSLRGTDSLSGCW